jgi:dienelactone hydrolase
MLWFNGAVDHQVPTTVNAEILRSLHQANWEIDIAPGVDHGLFENPSGLEPDEPKASKLAAGLWDKIATWLSQNAITR